MGWNGRFWVDEEREGLKNKRPKKQFDELADQVIKLAKDVQKLRKEIRYLKEELEMSKKPLPWARNTGRKGR